MGIRIVGLIALTACMHGYASDDSARVFRTALIDIAKDIEALKEEYAQLDSFSVGSNLDEKNGVIQYAFRTHRAKHAGGWTSGVPNPDEDGLWFYFDFHDPASVRQIHTQPIVRQYSLGGKRCTFLILEGARTKTVHMEIRRILGEKGILEVGK